MSNAEADLTKLLAATLVQKEVMEPMNKIGWGHGTPPAPDYSTTEKIEGAPAVTPVTQPAPAAGTTPVAVAPVVPAVVPAKADAPQFSFNIEDFKNPITGEYFDKYKTAAEAMKGLGHLANMAKTSFSERDAARTQLAEIQAENAKLRSTPAVTPTAAAPAPSSLASRAKVEKAQQDLDAVLSQVSEDGGVFSAETSKRFSEAQRELIRAETDFRLAESREQERRASDAENARWKRVNEYMDGKYPTAAKFATEIGLHVQTDPLLAKAVAALVSQGSEVEASEMAWLAYERAVKASGDAASRAEAEMSEEELAAREKVRQDAKARALKDAGVVSGSAGGAGIHVKPNAGPSHEEVEALGQEMKRSGDAPGSPAASAWRHAVIGRFLDPKIFGPGR